MRGPDGPGGRAEQRSREVLSLEVARGQRRVEGVVPALRERVSDGGGGHRCQVGGQDLSGERLTSKLLSQN